MARQSWAASRPFSPTAKRIPIRSAECAVALTCRSRPTARCSCVHPALLGDISRSQTRRERPLTEDGWLRTGDAGFVDPRGHLVIIDRAKDVGKLADGSPFAPQYLENKLKFSPYI